MLFSFLPEITDHRRGLKGCQALEVVRAGGVGVWLFTPPIFCYLKRQSCAVKLGQGSMR
jgi:hypothetical protein